MQIDKWNKIYFRYGRILTPEEVATATVNGTLVNQEIVYVPAAMGIQLRIAAALVV